MKELEYKGKPADGQIVQYDAATKKWYPVDLDAPSGASVTGLGDYVRWHRDGGPVDATSGTFDFDVDLADSSGTTIELDDSSDWIDDVAGWGFAAPRVTAAGLYAVVGTIAADNGVIVISGKVRFIGDDGNPIEPFNAGAPTFGWFGDAVVGANPSKAARINWTGYLPLGAHVVLDNVAVNGGDPNGLDLVIQHAG